MNFFGIVTRPELFEQLKKASQLTDFKVEADYSYAIEELVGDSYVLVGDAARFVDPIFSSGVSVALNSSRFAARDIIKALDENTISVNAFANYSVTIKKGINTWYRFIGMYYRLNVLFTYFVNHPDHRLSVLKLLQEDVYDDSHEALISEMEKMVESIENNPNHPLHAYLGDLTSRSFSI